MRNIRVAPRSEWVSNRPPAMAGGRRSRLTNWLATLPIALLIPALIVPFQHAQASTPTITASPATLGAGDPFRVQGTGFQAAARGALLLDSVTTLGTYRAGRDGSFKARVKVPGVSAPGPHILSARGGGNAQATTAITVTSASDVPTPGATTDPTATAPPAPTSAPTSPPEPTAAATPAPPAATAAATPAPPAATAAATTQPSPTAPSSSSPTSGTTYYVATNGSDANDGSIDSPWRTFAKAAASVPAGATVLGRAGTYGGFTVSRNGKNGDPTRFAAYPGESVTIQGDSSRANVILVTGAHDIVIDDLTIKGAPSQYGAGVRVEAGSYQVTIKRSVLRNNRSFGIKIADSTDVTVKNNNIGSNETGIEISRAGAGIVIDGNRIHDNDRMVTSSRGGNGIVFHLTTGRIEVTDNQLWGNRAPHLDGVGYDGGAFEVYGASNLVISGNVLWDNNNAMETGTDGTPCSGNRFTRNIVRGLGAVAGETTGMILRCADQMLVAHNTFDGLDDYAFYVTASGGYAGSIHDLRVIDNIVIHGRAFSLASGLPGDIQIDYNVVNPGGSATYASYVAYVHGFGNTDSLAEFKTWTGYEAHGLQAAPRFVDASGGDYHLRSDSPAIDIGMSYGESYSGSAPDPGRYEWSP